MGGVKHTFSHTSTGVLKAAHTKWLSAQLLSFKIHYYPRKHTLSFSKPLINHLGILPMFAR